ncbi:MAG TPA: hypothetical protein VF013_03205, partial [Candidatus Limnocylindria bacterium]
LDGVAHVIERHDRYPDRLHYVEHAAAICADRRHPVSAAGLDALIARAAAAGMRPVEAQARRLRGILGADAGELHASLELFEASGIGRYAARVRWELASLTGDAATEADARASLERLGELETLLEASAKR